MTPRVVFMGTPRFALPSLQTLLGMHVAVVGVITQPERPTGRGRQPQPSPVHVMAVQHGLHVLTPSSLRAVETVEQMRAWQPDVIVVAAFGMLLPAQVLDIPPSGCLNVHASLLPRWRGAAPIAAAILAGDAFTGATLMKMEAGLDTGPIVRQASLPIAPDDTQGSLTDRLGQIGADLLHDTLPDWLAGRVTLLAQEDTLATYAPPLKKEQGQIDWHEPAEQIARRVRAFHPWPGTFTGWRGAPLKILRVHVPPESPRADAMGDLLPPGSVVTIPSGPAIVTGEGLLGLVEVQPTGKRPMSAADFARGARDFVGSQLT
jgi:methionyl-tRNA formyltransferase